MRIISKGKQKKFCRHAPESIIEMEGVEYYAADQRHAIEFQGDLVVNFTKSPNLPINDFGLGAHFDVGFANELLVPWPDFELPKVKLTFWRALHKMIKKKGWKKVCFHCAAGHGRTGTAIVSMMIAVGEWRAEDALTWVRTHYCMDAVESFDQCEYLEEVDLEYNANMPQDPSPLIPSMLFHEDEDKNKSILI